MQDASKLNPLENFDLQNWGTDHVAYLRKAVIDGVDGYAICSATGTVIGFSASRDKALGAIVQNDLEPMQVH